MTDDILLTADRVLPGPTGQIVLNGLFVLLFAGAALLFARAAGAADG